MDVVHTSATSVMFPVIQQSKFYFVRVGDAHTQEFPSTQQKQWKEPFSNQRWVRLI